MSKAKGFNTFGRPIIANKHWPEGGYAKSDVLKNLLKKISPSTTREDKLEMLRGLIEYSPSFEYPAMKEASDALGIGFSNEEFMNFAISSTKNPGRLEKIQEEYLQIGDVSPISDLLAFSSRDLEPTSLRTIESELEKPERMKELREHLSTLNPEYSIRLSKSTKLPDFLPLFEAYAIQKASEKEVPEIIVGLSSREIEVRNVYVSALSTKKTPEIRSSFHKMGLRELEKLKPLISSIPQLSAVNEEYNKARGDAAEKIISLDDPSKYIEYLEIIPETTREDYFKIAKADIQTRMSRGEEVDNSLIQTVSASIAALTPDVGGLKPSVLAELAVESLGELTFESREGEIDKTREERLQKYKEDFIKSLLVANAGDESVLEAEQALGLAKKTDVSLELVPSLMTAFEDDVDSKIAEVGASRSDVTFNELVNFLKEKDLSSQAKLLSKVISYKKGEEVEFLKDTPRKDIISMCREDYLAPEQISIIISEFDNAQDLRKEIITSRMKDRTHDEIVEFGNKIAMDETSLITTSSGIVLSRIEDNIEKLAKAKEITQKYPEITDKALVALPARFNALQVASLVDESSRIKLIIAANKLYGVDEPTFLPETEADKSKFIQEVTDELTEKDDLVKLMVAFKLSPETASKIINEDGKVKSLIGEGSNEFIENYIRELPGAEGIKFLEEANLSSDQYLSIATADPKDVSEGLRKKSSEVLLNNPEKEGELGISQRLIIESVARGGFLSNGDLARIVTEKTINSAPRDDKGNIILDDVVSALRSRHAGLNSPFKKEKDARRYALAYADDRNMKVQRTFAENFSKVFLSLYDRARRVITRKNIDRTLSVLNSLKINHDEKISVDTKEELLNAKMPEGFKVIFDSKKIPSRFEVSDKIKKTIESYIRLKTYANPKKIPSEIINDYQKAKADLEKLGTIGKTSGEEISRFIEDSLSKKEERDRVIKQGVDFSKAYIRRAIIRRGEGVKIDPENPLSNIRSAIIEYYKSSRDSSIPEENIRREKFGVLAAIDEFSTQDPKIVRTLSEAFEHADKYGIDANSYLEKIYESNFGTQEQKNSQRLNAVRELFDTDREIIIANDARKLEIPREGALIDKSTFSRDEISLLRAIESNGIKASTASNKLGYICNGDIADSLKKMTRMSGFKDMDERYNYAISMIESKTTLDSYVQRHDDLFLKIVLLEFTKEDDDGYKGEKDKIIKILETNIKDDSNPSDLFDDLSKTAKEYIENKKEFARRNGISEGQILEVLTSPAVHSYDDPDTSIRKASLDALKNMLDGSMEEYTEVKNSFLTNPKAIKVMDKAIKIVYETDRRMDESTPPKDIEQRRIRTADHKTPKDIREAVCSTTKNVHSIPDRSSRKIASITK